MMIDKIKEHIAKIEDFTAKTKEELEQFRIYGTYRVLF